MSNLDKPHILRIDTDWEIYTEGPFETAYKAIDKIRDIKESKVYNKQKDEIGIAVPYHSIRKFEIKPIKEGE
jgi:hypothetical protein